ncbi:neuropeptide F-like [Pollicipes pollicipes]|uniref:neuropeptide F-like n=1 Tax=Pollicipes pollicipes TaxID=41117 RepID=UPI001884AE4E|nr:neuropeptide F-like [Pollicipes pollicipes]
MHRTLLLLALVVCTLALIRPGSAHPNMARYTRDREDMAKTLSFLRKLDDYYSQVSRPRFGKRAKSPQFYDDARVAVDPALLGQLLAER